MIYGGAIQIARAMQESDIWSQKPAWWLKVWIYILMEVNHKENKQFKKGTNFFNYDMVYMRCSLAREGVKTKSLKNLIAWLKVKNMLTTQKTTRGFIISVCNYTTYQDLKSYTKNTPKNTVKNTERTQEEHRNHTINKNVRMKELNNNTIGGKKQPARSVPTLEKDCLLDKENLYLFFCEEFHKTDKQDFYRLTTCYGTEKTRDFILRMKESTKKSNPIGFLKMALKNNWSLKDLK